MRKTEMNLRTISNFAYLSQIGRENTEKVRKIKRRRLQVNQKEQMI